MTDTPGVQVSGRLRLICGPCAIVFSLSRSLFSGDQVGEAVAWGFVGSLIETLLIHQSALFRTHLLTIPGMAGTR